MRYVMLLSTTVATAFGQTYQIKDHHGIPIVEISSVEMFRYSEIFRQYVPDFRASARNVYGTDWNNDLSPGIPLIVTVRKQGRL
jgi:hypothetical protein